jgi:predicted MFS family arabinose efflux permease
MFRQAFARYINNFRGFRREIWILAIITFINRAGTMVLPFLSKYLREDLKFSHDDVGTVLVFFGLGSLIGSWLGGKLSDKIGFYKVMVFSLFTSGLLFFTIQYITSFYGMCAAMFGIMVVADMFRPAMFVSIGTYAKPENRTRALTLVRLAVNLGFGLGPAMGGLLIVGLGYKALFWVDGTTCILAITLFWLLVKEKKKVDDTNKETLTETVNRNVYRDGSFWIFLFCSFAATTVFFQLFSTLPIYHREHYSLTEFETGLLMSLNGLLIFALEMPLVGYFERKNVEKLKIVFWGSFLMGASMLILLFNQWAGILVVSMLLITFAEMFNFPFSNAFAMNRAPRGQEGRYMALYTMTFSAAHMVSAKAGLSIVSKWNEDSGGDWGYQVNWLIMGALGLLSCILLLYLRKRVATEVI